MCKIISVVLLILQIALSRSVITDLDRYVHKPDPNFSWKLLDEHHLPARNVYILNMTSQRWLNDSFVNPSIWFHYVTIIIPSTIRYPEDSLLFIGSGRNSEQIPDINDSWISSLSFFAVATGMISVDLKYIPVQPTKFNDDPKQKERTEDSILAYCWRKFMETGDSAVLGRLPMTKAAVNAMTTVQEFLRIYQKKYVYNFIIAGASKRGWTTWTTAAVDKRVIAFVPIVENMLYLNKMMHHMYKSLGGWTFEFADYYYENITDMVDSPEFYKLSQIIDPIFYNDRYQGIPKLLLTAASDEFFLPDNENIYWEELAGPKYISRLPNTGHSLSGFWLRAMETVGAFIDRVKTHSMPTIEWKITRSFDKDCLRVTTTTKEPNKVILYRTRTISNQARDFRKQFSNPNNPIEGLPSGIFWREDNFTTISKNEFEKCIPVDYSHFDATYFELHFPKHNTMNILMDLTLSSILMVTPEIYPQKDCSNAECFGKLV
ncbi:hypothetical protein SNEBB_011216 [Seison nebaliae]|nr:hypothetical protein SNEBB_011216 [Seison nebaliae]